MIKMKNRNGDTIISVMVAFVMLMVGISMIGTSIQFSMKLLGISERARQDAETASRKYYIPDPANPDTAVLESVTFSFKEINAKTGHESESKFDFQSQYNTVIITVPKIDGSTQDYYFYSLGKRE